jgi:hypothetical protein
LRLLGALHRAIPGAGQIRIPLEILPRINQRCLIRRNLLPGLLDHKMLLRDLLVQRVDGCLRRRDIGARPIERGLVITWIDAGDDITPAQPGPDSRESAQANRANHQAGKDQQQARQALTDPAPSVSYALMSNST